jgi:hypothetical protein
MTTDFFVFICKTDLSKPVKQEVNSTVRLPPLVFPGLAGLETKSKVGTLYLEGPKPRVILSVDPLIDNSMRGQVILSG